MHAVVIVWHQRTTFDSPFFPPSLIFKIFLCLYFAYMYVYDMYVWCSRGKRMVLDPWNWSTGGCELPHGCREPNPGSMKVQPMFLSTEPCLQPHSHVLSSTPCFCHDVSPDKLGDALPDRFPLCTSHLQKGVLDLQLYMVLLPLDCRV